MRFSALVGHLFRLAVLQLSSAILILAGTLEEGQALLKAGKLQEAEAAFAKAITESPDSVSPLLGRAKARLDAGNIAGAEIDFNRALEVSPGSAAALRARGLFREMTQNNFAGAIEDYSRVIQMEPKANAVFMERGRARMKSGDLQGSLDDLDQALAIKPDYVVAFVGRGTVLGKLNRDKEAVESFQRALALEPNNAAAKKGLAALQARKAGKGGRVATAPVEETPTPKNAKTAATQKLSATRSTNLDGAKVPPATASSVAPPPENTVSMEQNNPVMRHRYYRLVKAEMLEDKDHRSNFAGTRQFEGQGAKAGYTWSYPDNKGQTVTSRLRWEVPEVLVPGQPARFRIEASVGGGGSAYGGILWQSPPFECDTIVGACAVAAVRHSPGYGVGPIHPVDETEFVLPDIGKALEECREGKGERVVVVKLRNLEKMNACSQQFQGGRYTDSDIRSIEALDYPHKLKGWVWGSEATRYRDLVFEVRYFIGWTLARYTYRCSDDAADDYEFALEPKDRKDLQADGQDGVILKARAKSLAGTTLPAPVNATSSVVFSAQGPGAAWADLSKAEMRDGWKVVYVQASNPDIVHGPGKPPETIAIRADGQDGQKYFSGIYDLKIAANPVIDAKPDTVEFLAATGASERIAVGIQNPGDKPWHFRTEFAQKKRPLANVSLSATEGSSTVLTVTEAGIEPQTGGAPAETGVLRILAEQKDRQTLERDVRVFLAQEGLYVSATGRDPDGKHYRVSADGKGKTTDVDFRVFLFDPVKKRLIANKEAVGQLRIECLETEGSPAAIAMKTGGFKQVFAGTRAQNDATGIYRFSLANELPGDGRTIRCDFKASLPGSDGETYTAIFTLGFVTTSNGPGSADWQLEYDRCQEIIHKFVPAKYFPMMEAMLEKRKHTLGAEGLRQLRERIWVSAVNFTLGEGGQGYKDEAAWADRITETLEWSQWAGDMAFGAVIGTWTGPYGAFGASQLKSSIISAINAYQDGQTPQEWLWGNLATIPGIIEGKVIDVDTFEKLGVQNKAKAWAIYVSYHFLKNLYQGQTIIEALKNTAKEAGGSVLSSWLSAEVKANGNRSVAGWVGDKSKEAAQAASSSANAVRQKLAPAPAADTPTPAAPAVKNAAAKTPTPGESAEDAVVPVQKKSTEPSEAAKQIARRTQLCLEDKPYAHPDDVLEIMRDPSKVRSLKEAPPQIQAAFSNTRESIYRQHDTAVVQHVKDTVPGMKYRMVKVMEFRTPGQTGPSLNTDRDYRVCYYAGRDPHTGKEQWVEVPRQHWQDKSYQTFAELTGGPTDSPEHARQWAERHQQLATDQYHKEASKAFTDQKKVWNDKTRQVESIQVVSNIERITKQKIPGVNVEDPQSLGQMYQVKVQDAHHPHEAFVQANKAVGMLAEIRKVYGEQGRKIGNLPPRLQAGMDAVTRVNEQLKADPNRRDPAAIAEANRTLQANGFLNVNDFMAKLGGQFESLKFAAVPPEQQ